MPDPSHFHRLRSVVSGLSALDVPVHVFTGSQFQLDVERAGGTFVDLFSSRPLDAADAESMPMPCRLVSYAGCFAGAVAPEVAALDPSLVIHDTFAVIGWVVADLLGVPRVNVCAGHNVVPSRFLALLAGDPRVRISPRCADAVRLLRTRYGVSKASPFSYVEGFSRDLNLYCEPPAFLDGEERAPFEPLAFWGSLPGEIASLEKEPSELPPMEDDAFRVYISFGTVVWRYYAADALRALAALAEWFGRQPKTKVVISLGGASVEAAQRAALTRPNVVVEQLVDQWAVLAQSDCFITHQGLNSTHEAIHHRVPMISYPFFWDQPALAEKCCRFGLAISLSDQPRGPVREREVEVAWQQFLAQRNRMRAALTQACEWERAVVAARPAVLRRMRDLGR
jgi:UDP:flavonoid glycosyltransferase YjiC (YdhE family)